MAAQYTINVYDPFGTLIRIVPNEAIIRLGYSLQANAVGSLVLRVARDALPDDGRVGADTLIEVWRRPDEGGWTREGETAWLVQKAIIGVSQQDGQYLRLEAVSALHLLTRRHVRQFAHNPGDGAESQAENIPADNAIKKIIRESMGNDANSVKVLYDPDWGPTRIWSTIDHPTWGIAVAADVSAASSITKDFAWRQVLVVCQEIASDAGTIGEPVYFDMVALTTSTFEFRTYITQRGIDRTAAANQLVLSPERGNLGGTVELETSWENTANLVIAGGPGQKRSRVLGHAWDDARIGQSTFGLREYFLNATQSDSAASLEAEASAELRRRRPKVTLTGDLLSTPDTLYGLHWGWGDRVIAELDRQAFVANVDAVSVKLERGQEAITARLTGEPV
jgi:hypothetical protein